MSQEKYWLYKDVYSIKILIQQLVDSATVLIQQRCLLKKSTDFRKVLITQRMNQVFDSGKVLIKNN